MNQTTPRELDAADLPYLPITALTPTSLPTHIAIHPGYAQPISTVHIQSSPYLPTYPHTSLTRVCATYFNCAYPIIPLSIYLLSPFLNPGMHNLLQLRISNHPLHHPTLSSIYFTFYLFCLIIFSKSIMFKPMFFLARLGKYR